MRMKTLMMRAVLLSTVVLMAACAPGFSAAPSEKAAILPEADSGSDATGDGGASTPVVDGQKGRCQSETLCVHDQMPLWSQADGSTRGILRDGKVVNETLNVNGAQVPLIPYIQSQGYSNVKGDPGWCGAVSFAMLAKSWQKELAVRGESLKSAASVSFLEDSDPSVVIFKTMGLIGMRPDLGVSSPNAHEQALKTMAAATGKGTAEIAMRMMSVSEFRETYKRPLVTLGIGAAAAGGHFVALNGTDGQNYIVFDPWGASYTVKATKGTVEKESPLGKYYEYSLSYLGSGMKTLTGVTSGFIPTYGATTGVLNSIQLSGY